MLVLKRMPAAVVLASVVAACGDSLSPDSVDPAALEARAAAVTSTFNNNAAFRSEERRVGKECRL